MKKILSSAIVITFGVMLFSACNRCSTCSYTYRLADKDSTITLPEQCGNKQEIKDYEAASRAEGARNNGTVTCN